MFEEPVSEPPERGGHAVPKVLARPFAGLVRLGPPRFDDAVRRVVVGGHEPAGVGREPEGREVGIEFLGEDQVEVGLDVGRAREARVVAEDPDSGPVRDHTPERAGLGVQVLLHHAVRCRTAAVAAEARIRLVQVEIMCQEQQRDRAAARAVRELEDPLIELDAAGRRQALVPERSEQRNQPVVHPHAGRAEARAGAAFGVPRVEIVADHPVPGDLVLDRQRFREPVVRAALAGRGKGGHFGEELGRQDPAFDLERREAPAVPPARHRQILAMGRRT